MYNSILLFNYYPKSNYSMARNIKYRSGNAFLHAVETGSFTLGANRLRVTHPSFTALIQDLEHVLDLKLFERSTRAIALTSAGTELRDRIQRPIADLEEAYRSMEDLAAVRRGQDRKSTRLNSSH